LAFPVLPHFVFLDKKHVATQNYVACPGLSCVFWTDMVKKRKEVHNQ